MKLKDYLKHLQELVEEHPEMLEYDVVYSSDDEGNDFKEVIYLPSTGTFKDGEWRHKEADVKPNAICIN